MAGKARWTGLAAAAMLWGVAAPVSAAQAPGPDGRTVYQAAYFEQFARQHAA